MLSATIRSRAPLRLGLAGGGTDLSPFCDAHGGAVLNCTVDRYAYAFIAPRSDGQVVFEARDIGAREVHRVGEPVDAGVGLRLHRGVYNHFFRNYARGGAPRRVSAGAARRSGSGHGKRSSTGTTAPVSAAARRRTSTSTGSLTEAATTTPPAM